MIQIICGIILVLIGVLVFWKYPIKSDAKSLSLAALFIILAAILNRLSIMIPLFGFESLNISIEVIPMMLAGILLAPGYCYIIGIAIDLVGLLVNPTGFPFLGFTLNAVLQCLIPSLIVTTIKENRLNYLEKVIKILLIVLVVGACSYVFSLNQVTISNNVVTISTSFKIIMSIICVIMIAILFIVMHFYKKKLNEEEYYLFNIWLISVVIVEMAVSFVLTPYWLETMYGIPFTLSLFIRVIKECIMIPVDIILGYSVLRILKKLKV
ncbi:folate family ECF transporter S component [Coprobacillaceae bacterium CR2/5/TPMF4]|uniref:folate family ECF transporter S component n=1 Tax=uncultured Thomasclavelia sp. TaxID=3025759 RepID=UPI00263078A4|nr:folate family ECF transporter S component [uncultured Thomasclavelia sp.]WRK54023.1 folate family ECF transporter S component [Coprobacillaceae bacterium CR2/5/TPMF4]